MKAKLLKNKWFLAFVLATVIAIAAVTVAIIIGVTPKDQPDAPIEKPSFENGEEAGVYYYDVVDGKVTLTIRDGSFTMSGKINKTGTYTVDGSTISFDFFKDEDGTATGTLNGDTLSVVYNDDTTMSFLKEIDYTVSFVVNGGSEIPSVTVVNGKPVAKPAEDPTKANHVFLGWYEDEACTVPFSFDSSVIKSDLSIYARWVEKKVGVADYTVNLNLGYADAPAQSITTISGVAYDIPTPEREGYVFGGWWVSMYEDGEKLSYAYTEGMSFTADTTLYAVWHEKDSEKLMAPAVSVTGSTISWNPVEKAVSYKLTIIGPDGKAVIDNETVGTTTKAFAFGDNAAGEYKISVVAVASNTANNSEPADRYFSNKALDRVSDFHVENGILIFGAVENAQKYTITIDCGDDNHTHTDFDNGTSTTYYLANCPMQKGGIKITVTASANGYATSVSNVFVYEKNLDGITNIAYDKDADKFVWDAVSGASSYQVTITAGGKEYTFDNGMLTSFSTVGFSGDITISVVPTASGYNSPDAITANCVKTAPATPDGIVAMGNKIFWNAVEGAASYEVNIGGQAINVTTNELDLVEAAVTLTQGQVYAVKVKAINASNESSEYSTTVSVGYFVMDPYITYSKNTVHWSPVLGITDYQVRVNGANVINVSNVTSAKVVLTQEGDNLIEVRYRYGDSFSDWASVTVKAYVIEYDSRSTSGSVKFEYLAPGDVMTLPKTGFTYEGYDFANWYNAPKGVSGNGKLYTEGSIFTGNSYTVVYGDWTPKSYNVIFKTDGFQITNIESGATESVTYTKDFTLTVPNAKNEGMYYFAGWYTGPSGTGIQITDETGASIAPYAFTKEITLYPYYATNALKFTLQSDGTYAVSKGESIADVVNLKIPVTFNEIPITTILESGFSGCSTIKTVQIPDTVTLVGTSALSGCSNLESIEVYKAKDGEYETFYSSIDGVLIREDMGTTYLEFVPKAKRGSFTIPANVDKILTKAFNSSKLSTIVIPATITEIPNQAFYYCSELRTVIIEGNRTSPIEFSGSSFYQCSKIESLTLPATVNMEYSKLKSFLDTFYQLKNITIEEGGEAYASIGGILTNGAKDKILYCPRAYAGDITIPKGVTTIGENAFNYREYVTSITIPVWVTSIEYSAFNGCKGAKTITFKGNRTDNLVIDRFAFAYTSGNETITFEGNGTDALDTGVVSIGENAFAVSSITSLRTIDIGAGVNIDTIGKNAFKGNAKLRNINVDPKAKVDTIGEYAFTKCTGLVSVSIPASVTNISAYAFADCVSLTNISFVTEGATAISIADYAFQNCTKLGTITLPDHLDSFNSSAFDGCDSLKSIKVNETNKHYITDENGILYKKTDDNTLSELLFYPKGLAKANNGIVNNLPETLTTIGGAAFSGNKFVVSVTLPKSVTTIGNSAFADCDSLENVIFDPKGEALTIGNSAFINCTSLSDSFLLPEYTTEIGDSAFANCQFTKFVIPQKVTSIGKAAFHTCDKLVDLVFVPHTILDDDGNIKYTLTIGATATNAATGAFSKCSSLKSIVLPAGTTDIGKYAFNECTALESVDLGDSVTVINNSAFYCCYALNKVVIPNTVKTIGNSAFGGKSSTGRVSDGSLTEVIFEEGGTEPLTIGATAFQYQSKLTSITLPARTSTIGNMPNKTATTQSNIKDVFNYCEALAEVNIANDGEKKAFTSLDGVLYNTDMTVLYFCPRANVGKYVDGVPTYELIVPKTVKTVMTKSFYDLTALKTLTFEEYAKDDANYGKQLLTFGNTSKNYSSAKSYSYAVIGGNVCSITTINLPSHLSTIKGAAFGVILNGRAPIDININPDANNLTLENYAFAQSGAKALYLPSIKELGTNAFDQCYFVESIYFRLTNTKTTKLPNGTFYNCLALTSIDIPDQFTEYGNDAFRHTDSLKSYIIPDKVTKTGTYTFAYSGLESIVIPTSLTNIGNNAFSYCESLKTVTFATNENGQSPLNKLPNYMFSSCTSLENVNFEALYHITEIGNSAFNKCTPLTGIDFTKFTNLTKIGTTAFSYTGLVNVDLSQTKLTELSTSFNNNASLKTLVLCDTIKTINASAFNNDTALESVTLSEASDGKVIAAFKGKSFKVIIPENNISLVIDEYGVVYDPSFQTLYYAGGKANDLTGYKIPDTVLEIYNYAFSYAQMDQLVIPEGVVTIGEYAFQYSDIPYIYISSTVTTIGKNAFDSSELKNIEFAPNSQLTSLGNFAFDSSKIEKVVFPDNLDFATNQYSIFLDCTELKSVTFGAATKYIPSNCFGGCMALEEIIFQEGLETIDQLYSSYLDVDKDSKYNNVKSVVIPSTVKTIAKSAFCAFRNLETVTFAQGSVLETIEKCAFGGCYKLQSINLPASVATLGDMAFYNCKSLKSIDLGETAITAILEETFRNTESLETIVFPKNIATIGDQAFRNTGIVDLVLPSSLTGLGISAFEDAVSMKTIVFPADSMLTVLGSTEENHNLFKGTTSLETVVLPNSMTVLGAHVFENSGVKNIYMSEPEAASSLQTVGAYAFANCVNLTAFDYIAGVTTIDDCAFFNCQSLTKATPGEKLETMGTMAFGFCVNLDKAYIPASVSVINGNPYGGLAPAKIELNTNNEFFVLDIAENGTLTLYDTEKSVIYGTFGATGEYKFADTVTAVEEGAFAGNAITSITLPKSINQAYDFLFMNCDKLENVEFLAEITRVGQYAFYGNASLATFQLDEGITEIGDYAFAYCSKLNNIVIPGSNKYVGNYCFAFCDVLSDVSFADPTKTGLVTLGTHIFYNCQSLTEVVLPTQFQTTDEESIFYTGYDSYSGYTIPSYMFAGTGIVNAVLPKTIEYGYTQGIFANCKNLEKIILESNPGSSSQIEYLYSPSWVEGCDKFQYFYAETFTSALAYLPEHLSLSGYNQVHVGTIVSGVTAEGFATYARFNYANDDFCLYIDGNDYTEIIPYFTGVARSWTMKIFDKNGNQLFSSDEDGTIAYVKDASGNVIWEAPVQQPAE